MFILFIVLFLLTLPVLKAGKKADEDMERLFEEEFGKKEGIFDE